MSLVLRDHSEFPFNRRRDSSAIGIKRGERAGAEAPLRRSLKLMFAFAMMALVIAVAVSAKLAIWLPTYLH
ncbi:MAG: hypothetical protein QOH18_1643 [Solirubrobacterales bacterium]|nr:hypothetical protein [Solirubrobacterales bacterium]